MYLLQLQQGMNAARVTYSSWSKCVYSVTLFSATMHVHEYIQLQIRVALAGHKQDFCLEVRALFVVTADKLFVMHISFVGHFVVQMMVWKCGQNAWLYLAWFM